MAELDTCDTSKIAYKKEFEQGVKESAYLSNLAITSSTQVVGENFLSTELNDNIGKVCENENDDNGY